MALKPTEDQALAHPPEIIEWRKYRAGLMGYDEFAAILIAHTSINITDLEKLIERGCPNDLALKILFGTNQIGEEDYNWIDAEIV